MGSKPTVFDVARLSEVSRGTVDRVLHRRGRVSRESEARVRQVMEELGYRPDENASKLASRKVFRIASLTPESISGDYWGQIDRGFKDGLVEACHYHNIEFTPFHFNESDRDSFEKASENMLRMNPDGVILTDILLTATTELAASLQEKNIPYAFIDTKDDSLPYVVHYGINPEKSGELGAWLLGLAAGSPENVAIISVARDPSLMADPNGKRRDAFIRSLLGKYPGCRLYQISIDPYSKEKTSQAMDSFREAHPEVDCYVVASSRLYLIGEWLRANPDDRRIMIGFEDLEANMKILREGLATFLITRHISYQSRDLLVDFSRFIAEGKLPGKRDNYVHVDILCKKNTDDY